MIRVPYERLVAEMQKVLVKKGYTEERAEMVAKIFADNSLAGVPTHGFNRFARAVFYLNKGMIDPKAEPEVLISSGAFERWDGHRGFGPLNCRMAMDRACDLAKQYGVGLVALGNNNHWLRGAAYGFQAADRGMIGICWTNAQPNMPAWGAKDRRIGNNPIVFAVPRSNGKHIVVDCAMSQFSYGALENARMKGEKMPFAAGYDTKGELTTDPSEIEKTWRILPTGYWKGSGLSILFDLIGAILSGGNSVAQIGALGDEIAITQICIAIDPSRAGSVEENDRIADAIIADLKASEPVVPGGEIRYPGERETRVMEENRRLGVPVLEDRWEELLRMYDAPEGEEVESLIGTSEAANDHKKSAGKA